MSLVAHNTQFNPFKTDWGMREPQLSPLQNTYYQPGSQSGSGLFKYPNTRPGFKGELHIPGYNFCGPGTKLLKRLDRGDLPVNKTDAVCRTHDIDYSKATSKEDVRAADLKMIRSLKGVKGASKLIPKIAIGTKIMAEDLGILDPATFNKKIKKGKGKKPEPELTEHEKNILKKIKGIRSKDPAKKLRKKIKHKKKKNK